MIAEPRTGGGTEVGVSAWWRAGAAWVRWVAAWARVWALPAALYAVAAVLLLVRIGAHPRFAYNWEGYTAWRFFAFWEGPGWSPDEVFALTDGLMTDSGRGPLVGLPVWFGFSLGGVGLTELRLPVALVAAAAVPLLWLVGRRLVGSWAAGLAALLLALSPVYLLYGRTATLVGISLVPALLTIEALLRVLARTDDQDEKLASGTAEDVKAWSGPVGWLVALQLCLVAGIYAYAPVRLLWPLAVGLLAVAAWRRRSRWLLVAAAVTASVLPLTLVAIDYVTADVFDPRQTAAGYFRARGEQVLAMRNDPAEFRYYLRSTDAEVAAGAVQGSAWELARRLIGQNAGDLLRLLLDLETRPTLTDHWNAQGRLWSPVVATLFWLGLAATLVRAVVRRQAKAWVVLALAVGLTMPVVLSSRVDVGRLVPALPLLLLIAGAGWAMSARRVADWVGDRVRWEQAAWGRRLVGVVLAGVVVIAVGWSTWADYRTPPPPTRESTTAAALAGWVDAARERGGAALVESPTLGLEVEGVHAASYRLELDGRYRFVDLTTTPVPPRSAADERPALYVGGVLGRLQTGDLPNLCDNVYLVVSEAERAFRQARRADGIRDQCRGRLRFEVVPGSGGS